MTKDNDRGFEALARKGRGGDTEIGHLTEGELVVPVSILARFPEARDALFDAFREAGIDPDRYIVGSEENSVNPETGTPEYNEDNDSDHASGLGAGAANDAQARENDAQGGFQGPESQNVDGRDNDPSDRNRFGSGGGRRMTLPSEYADFILEDGRRLEDVLGKGFFKGNRKPGGLGGLAGTALAGIFGGKGRRGKIGPRERALAERRAQAQRLNQTRAILTGPQGVPGAANIDKSKLSGG